MRRGQPASSRRWRGTPRGKYSESKRRARQRGIGFDLTFDQWWDIWQSSGHWHERGARKTGYVMRRTGDEGPYAVGNVYIGTHPENAMEGWRNGKARAAQINGEPGDDVPF